MSALTDKLKDDHELIVEALHRAKEAGFSSGRCHEELLCLKEALLAHLHEEDHRLYPTLYSAAESDGELLGTLGLFARDMQEVTHEVDTFFQKYAQGGSSIDFAGDFGRVYALLGQRIRKEEEVLYTEYDKLQG